MSARDPYCRNCGYALSGLTESSKCPECGKPLVEVLERGPLPRMGRRYRSSIVVFGLPLVDIALGPGDDGKPGRAKGIIAIGDVAAGWLAIGGFARGLIAIGGMALGIFAMGGCAVGVIALGGGALGGVALGGAAIGGVVFGGGAIGGSATGGGAAGYFARGGGAYGKYVVMPARRDPEAIQWFDQLDSWLLVPRQGSPQKRLMVGYLLVSFWALVALLTIAVPAALAVLWELRRRGLRRRAMVR